MTTELDTFYEMVDDIGIAMMTTRRPSISTIFSITYALL